MSPSLPRTVDQWQRIVERFEEAWQAGARPALADYLQGTPPDGTPLLRELVHADLAYRLRGGDAVRVEEYLQRFPALATSDDAVIELLAAEFRQRSHLGGTPTPTEYLARFPQYHDRLLQTWVEDAATSGPGDDGARPLPERVGRYRVDRFLAQGGVAEVVRVLDGDFDRPLALKVLQSKYHGRTDLEERFLREARLTGQLQHPGIPPVQEMGRLPDGRPYFIMKLVKGRDLHALLRQRSGRQEQLTYYLGLFEQICRTVAYAHARGIIHRDLKPNNVMVGAFGEVQVMDWGFAKVLPADRPASAPATVVETSSTIYHVRAGEQKGEASVAGDVIGTPAYMAPEQARGEVEKLDARCDVFGLGGILCHILTGKPPFIAGSNLENQRQSMRGDLSKAFARLEGCGADAELIALAKRCLAPQGGDRPADAEEVAQAAAAYQEAVRQRLRQAELAHAQAEVRATEERRRRRWQLALAGSVLGLLALAALAGWWALEQQAEQERQDLLRAEEKNRDEERAQLRLEQAKKEQALILREEKKRQTERTQLAVDGALTQAAELQRKALFREARKTLNQAKELLGTDGDQALQAQLKAALDNLAFVERLDRIRQDKALIVDGKMNPAAASRLYADAFKEQGFDVVGGDPEALARRVAQSPFRDYLLAALDDWTTLTPDAGLRSRLCRLTAKLTGQDWREEVANAWHDKEKLEELLAKVPPKELPVALLVGLCSRLDRLGGDGVLLLEQARLRSPGDFWVWFELGVAYHNKGKDNAGKAVGAWAGCLAIRTDAVAAHYNLGNALRESKDLPGAIAAYREAIRLDPKDAKAHYNLGNALHDSKDLAGAIAAYQEAIRLDPTFAFAHANLGLTLRQQQLFCECVLAFQAAFTVEPGLANDLGNKPRYRAATAAVLAAAGQGKDAADLTADERAKLRQQVLAWLKADLAAWDKLLQAGGNNANLARKTLAQWQQDADLASVRGDATLAQLAEAERTAWRAFWADVDQILKPKDPRPGPDR